MFLRMDLSSDGKVPDPEEGVRQTSLEQAMNETKEKLDALENNINMSRVNSVTNLFLDLFDSGLGEDSAGDWLARLAEVTKELKILQEKISEVENRNRELSVLNIDLLTRNFDLEIKIRKLKEALKEHDNEVSDSEDIDHLKHMTTVPDKVSRFSEIFQVSKQKQISDMSSSCHKLCSQCHQILYPLEAYSNLHLENNQLKYQLIQLESEKLSLEFRTLMMRQEISRLKEASSRPASQLEVTLPHTDLDSHDDDDNDDTDEDVNQSKKCDSDDEKNQKKSSIKRSKLKSQEVPQYQRSSEIHRLRTKLTDLKLSKSRLKKKTRELLRQYRKKRDCLRERDEQLHAQKLALLKLQGLHCQLQHAHSEILESLRDELIVTANLLFQTDSDDKSTERASSIPDYEPNQNEEEKNVERSESFEKDREHDFGEVKQNTETGDLHIKLAMSSSSPDQVDALSSLKIQSLIGVMKSMLDRKRKGRC